MQPSINKADISQYMSMLFGEVDSGFVALRGLGEKGTDKEGVFRELIWRKLGEPPSPDLSAIHHATRWGEHNCATYVIPAVMKSDANGNHSNVAAFTALCLDIDSGDTLAALARAEGAIGPATMVARSGGHTKDGMPKLHAYWKLSEPEQDVDAVCLVRHKLAILCGGDQSFGIGRGHQPIRIPGTIHAKNGTPAMTSIDRYNPDAVIHFSDAQDALQGVAVQEPDPMDFAPSALLPPVGHTMTTTVQENSPDALNRWTAFSQIAGYWIAWAEVGKGSLDEAWSNTLGWMNAKMDPPWPLDRAQQEFRALLARHRTLHPPKAPEPTKEAGWLLKWAASQWSGSEPPQRRFLVSGLVPASAPQVLVAEGGAGKTFLMLDLALKVATYRKGASTEWCGQSLTDECAEGVVVMVTAEDDMDELHIRLSELDSAKTRLAAGARLVILPLINEGGTFAFATYDRDKTIKPSERWMNLMNEIAALGNVKLVIVDTLNSSLHGEESSAAIIQDWFRVVAGPICGKLGAALIVTHHIRKGEPIKSTEDMKAAVRGSGAILNSVRSGIGVWHAPDWKRRLTALGEKVEQGKCYLMSVIKANNPEMMNGVRTLIRMPYGALVDATQQYKKGIEAMSPTLSDEERLAWLVFGIKMAADEGYPFQQSYLSRDKKMLPPAINDMKKEWYKIASDLLLENKRIFRCKFGKSQYYLDVAEGPFAKGNGSLATSGAFAPYKPWDQYYYDYDLREIWEVPF